MTIQAMAPLRRVLLKDEVHGRLIAAIIDGDLEPGEALANADMEEWLGVSRSTLREAFSRLELAGLVTSFPNRYTRVSEVDVDQYQSTARVLRQLLVGAEEQSLAAADLRFASGEAPAGHLLRVVEQIAEAERNPVLMGIVVGQLLPLLRRDARVFVTGGVDVPYREAAKRFAGARERGEWCQARAHLDRMLELGAGWEPDGWSAVPVGPS